MVAIEPWQVSFAKAPGVRELNGIGAQRTAELSRRPISPSRVPRPSCYPRGMLSPGSRLYLAVDLGGTKMAVSLWRDLGDDVPLQLGETERWSTLSDGPGRNIELMVEASEKLLRSHAGGARPTAIGVSGGGPLNPVTGEILSVPNLPGWIRVPITKILSERLGAPARIENDANACAAAEWLYGSGRGATHMAFLTCSTGIGAGLVLDGRLYRGARFLAGEVGHHVIVPDGLACGCGKRGCLEAYASGSGIATRLKPSREKNPALPGTAKELVDAAKAGSSFAIEFLRETAELLAMGLANLVFILDLDRIVLGTIPTAAGELFFAPLRESLLRRLWPDFREGLELRPSALWPRLGDYAALAVARDLPRLVGVHPN